MRYFQLPDISYRVFKVWFRNWDVFRKTIKLNIIPPFLEPIMYLLALGFGLGVFVEEIEGVSYAQYIAPALISVSIMYSSFFECTYASYVRMYFQKTFDAIIATPLNIDEVIVGELIWGATRSFISATIMLPVLAAFGLIDLPASLLIIPLAFLAGLLFACIAMCFTAIAPNIVSLTYPATLFITPMFLFSGTFFPLDLLPVPVQYFALIFLPLTHLVIIARSLTFGVADISLLLNLAWIIIVTVIFFVLSINLMKRRLIV